MLPYMLREVFVLIVDDQWPGLGYIEKPQHFSVIPLCIDLQEANLGDLIFRQQCISRYRFNRNRFNSIFTSTMSGGVVKKYLFIKGRNASGPSVQGCLVWAQAIEI